MGIGKYFPMMLLVVAAVVVLASEEPKSRNENEYWSGPVQVRFEMVDTKVPYKDFQYFVSHFVSSVKLDHLKSEGWGGTCVVAVGELVSARRVKGTLSCLDMWKMRSGDAHPQTATSFDSEEMLRADLTAFVSGMLAKERIYMDGEREP
jgi:hypothetical protein